MSQHKNLLPYQQWQLKEIQNAICEADAGDFATQSEVNAVMNKWKLKPLEAAKTQD